MSNTIDTIFQLYYGNDIGQRLKPIYSRLHCVPSHLFNAQTRTYHKTLAVPKQNPVNFLTGRGPTTWDRKSSHSSDYILTDNGQPFDGPRGADVESVSVVCLRVGIGVVGVTVLEDGEGYPTSADLSAQSDAVLLFLLAARALEPAPPVVVATPYNVVSTCKQTQARRGGGGTSNETRGEEEDEEEGDICFVCLSYSWRVSLFVEICALFQTTESAHSGGHQEVTVFVLLWLIYFEVWLDETFAIEAKLSTYSTVVIVHSSTYRAQRKYQYYRSA